MISLPDDSPDWATARGAVALIKDKMKLLSEAPDLTSFFFGPPDAYDVELLVPKKVEPAQTRVALERCRAAISELALRTRRPWKTQLRALGEELGLKAGQLFMPIRVALTGRTVSPGLFGTLRVIGRDEALARLDAAIAKLASV